MKKVLAFVLVLSMILGSFGMAFAAAPSDIEGSDYKDALTVLLGLGVIDGYTDGTFQRSNPVSGNAFVKMVLVALGVTDIDFTAKGWQIDAIARAEEMKLLEGIADT